MTELDVHKCLISYGFFPMTLILKELESQDRFEECDIILKSMISYRERFKIVEDDVPTIWSQDFEIKYYSYFEKVDCNGVLLAKNNMDYYLSDISSRLKL